MPKWKIWVDGARKTGVFFFFFLSQGPLNQYQAYMHPSICTFFQTDFIYGNDNFNFKILWTNLTNVGLSSSLDTSMEWININISVRFRGFDFYW